MVKKIFNQPIISYTDIESNLVNIFSDAIITDTQFIITDVSPTILKLLNYRNSELIGRPLSILVSDDNLDLIFLLHQGYFTHTEFGLLNHEGQRVDVYLSGYFLGLISDINGKIIFLIKNKESIIQDKQTMDERVVELNDLIYRTSHDIRGPLATIKGLVNAAKSEEDFTNIQNYLNLITKVSDRLDLILEYLRESIRRKNYQLYTLRVDELINEISDRMKKLCTVYDIGIDLQIVKRSEESMFFTNPFLSSILVENLVLIMESLNTTKKGHYTLQIEAFNGYIQIKILAQNLTTNLEAYLNREIDFGKVKDMIKRSGYHYLNFRIIKICSEIIKSEIVIDNEVEHSLIVTIPSVLHQQS